MEITQSTSQLRTGSGDIQKYLPAISELFNSGTFKIGVHPNIVSSNDTEALSQFLSLGKQNKKKEACLIPFKANNKKMYTFGQILKPKVTANMGDVAEGVFAAAITVRFTNKNATVTKSDVISLLRDLPTPVARNKGKVVEKIFKSDNKDIDLKDDVILKIALAEGNMNFLLDSKSHSALSTYIDSAVKYANDKKVQKWAKLVYENGRYDKIEITSDGLSGQTSTKVDVDVKITNDKNVLQDVDIKVSLKAGDVKQFGQQGGTLFDRTGNKDGYKEYWDRLVGIDIESKRSEYSKLKELNHDTSGAINLIYDYIADELQKKLNKSTGVLTLKTLGEAIQYYATLNEEHVELVQLNKGEAKIYNFGNLPNILSQYNWDVEYTKGTSASSGERLPIITIHERGTASKKLLILRVKRETVNGSPYYRNYVEKGNFLGELIGRYASAQI
jgi:hypothetical protein